MPAPELLDFEVVDVFAPHPFSGNQLAVVLDAGELTTGQCQALAAEFGYSESTFVSAPSVPGADYRVRIFTPRTELPFAGHPSVGTAHTLVRLGRLPAGVVRQECGAGIVQVEVDGEGGARLTGGTVSLRPGPDVGALAAAVGLSADDATGRPAHLVGCGIDFAQLEVHPEALARAVPDAKALDALLPGVQGGVSVIAWDPGGAGTVRVFAAGLDWHEDPATGSAALGTGIWLAAEGLVGDGVTDYRLAQGAAVGRPSELAGRVTVSGGAVTAVSVAGAVRPIASGAVRVPPGS